MTFQDLLLCEPLLHAVQDQGYTIPTPIQLAAIPHVLAGTDLLGCAQTGTGKTAAFALPILHHLMQHAPSVGRRPIRTLVLAPTRELAAQIADSFRTYGRHTGLRFTVIFGGVGQNPQVAALKAGVDVVIATPGRLLDLMNQRFVDLSQLQHFVLDEADNMLDMGFIPDIRRIVSKIPVKRQTMLFSATMPNGIRQLADSILRKPISVQVSPIAAPAELVDQTVYFVDKVDKPSMLVNFLRTSGAKRVLVFSRTKHGADKIVRNLNNNGIRGEAIHGNKSQNARVRAMNNFKASQPPVLVATDIAARGLDIDEVSHVVNYELPNVPETYVHRIGRTGRAGATGIAISFCDRDERSFLRDIERLINRQIPVASTPGELPKLKFVQPHPVPAQHATGSGHTPSAARPRPMHDSADRPHAHAPHQPSPQMKPALAKHPHHRVGQGVAPTDSGAAGRGATVVGQGAGRGAFKHPIFGTNASAGGKRPHRKGPGGPSRFR